MSFTFSNAAKNSIHDSDPEGNDQESDSASGVSQEETVSPDFVWQSIQDAFAEKAGLAILLIDGKQPPSLTVSNNNSVCRVLQSSSVHAHLCEPYCGKAFENVQKAGKAISCRCHAGFQFIASPLQANAIRPLVAIVGRAFIRVADYQNLLDRLNEGDWQELSEFEIDKDLLFAESEREISEVSEAFTALCKREHQALIRFIAQTEPNPFSTVVETAQSLNKNYDLTENKILEIDESFVKLIKTRPPPDFSEQEPTTTISTIKQENNLANIGINKTLEDFTAWQLFTDALLDKSFKDACAETLRFLAARYDLTALAWLERASNNKLKPFIVANSLREELPKIDFAADDPRLQAAVLDETSYCPKNVENIELFPLAVGDDVRAVVVVADGIAENERRHRIARFCHQIAVSLEVLRLREELARRAEIVRAVQLFNEKLNAVSSESLFESLLETCAEFLKAERASLLIFDEIEHKLKVVAAVGRQAEVLKQNPEMIGKRIAERVFLEGKPIVIGNVSNLILPPAPLERDYRSQSFVSFPLITGNRTVGVLNITDKRDGSSYNQSDLDLLEAIAPQLAIALDRAAFQQRAGIFEQLSITDSLTSLLNRRYLNERLSEEVSRSNRDNSPMSFMMIDIDNFKQYNDRHGHQAGDEVLRLTAHCLKSVLRSADVAARYGGEEFSLLLPQTTLSEARLIAERIRQRIEKTAFPKRKITVSIGVAAYSPFHTTPGDIIEAADNALYQAKRIGKNNVQIWILGSAHDQFE